MVIKQEGKGNTVTVPAEKNFGGMALEGLLREIQESVAVMDTHRSGIDKEMRARLLPALLALKARTKRQNPGYYDHLRAMGLTVGRVKMWFYRANAGEKIEALVEEPEDKEPNQEKSTEPKVGVTWEMGDQMAQLVLAGKLPSAKRLAKQWAQARGLL